MTKFGTFSKLAISQIFRNKRRTFSALIGVLLAIILIVGINIVIEDTSRQVLLSQLDKLPYDFEGYYYYDDGYNKNISFENILSDIKDVENVQDAIVMSSYPVYYKSITLEDLNNNKKGSEPPIATLIGVSSDSKYLQRFFDIDTPLQLSTGQAAISQVLADDLKISVGDKITLSTIAFGYTYEPELTLIFNKTVSVNLTVGTIIPGFTGRTEPTYWVSDFFYDGEYSSFYYSSHSILVNLPVFSNAVSKLDNRDYWYINESIENIFLLPNEPSYLYLELSGNYDYRDDYYLIENEMDYYYLSGTSIYPEYRLFIWVDKDELVLPDNIEKSKTNIMKLRTELLFVTGYYFDIPESQITMILDGYGWWLMAQQFIYIPLSAPVILLGVYLAAIGIDMGMAERRREIGILKSRGASNRQVFGYFLIESIILGIITGILGIFFGLLTGKIFQFVLPSYQDFIYKPSPWEFYLSTEFILAIIGFSILLMVLATYRPAKRAANTTIIECLQYHSQEIEGKPYKPTVDIVMISLAVFGIVFGIIINPSNLDLETSMGVFFILSCVAILVVPLLFLSPILLVFGLTRLIVRSGHKIYYHLSKITKVISKDLWYIIHKNIVRTPKRVMGITTIIALSLAIGILITSTIESSQVFEQRVIEAEIGADISVEMYGGLQANIDYNGNVRNVDSWVNYENIKKDLEGIKGVSRVTEAQSIYINLPVASEYDTYLNIINLTTYEKVVKPDSYFFMGEDPHTILNKLKSKNSVLIDSILAKKGDYSVGDKLQASITTRESYNDQYETTFLSLKIVGIIRLLPGVPEDAGVWGEVYNLYIDVNTVKNYNIGNIESHRYLIDVASGFDHNEVAIEIRNIFDWEDAIIEVKKNRIDELFDNPMAAMPLVFLNIEYIFIIMIISIGLGLLMYVASIERKREIAGIVARGASSRQIKELYFGETLTIMILGIIIGVSVGLISSYSFNSFISFGEGAIESVIQRDFIVSLYTFSIIIFPIIALIITAYIVSVIASRMELNKALRLRGG